MEPLATQRCIEIIRKMNPIEEIITEQSFLMNLYINEIKVKNECYPITNIFDISYHRNSQVVDGIGFLYLHTNRGIQSYYIREEPTDFITAFKKLND